MSKWYRFSISLATKCRIGFAIAVLIIITAGLFIPYRWMDKLVEQGKLELAQAEVDYQLERHFKKMLNSNDPTGMPALMPERETDNPGPITEWIRLTSIDPQNVDVPLSQQIQEAFPEDGFLRDGIEMFLDDTTSDETIFALQVPRDTDVSDDSTDTDLNNTSSDQTHKPFTGENPARYLQAIYARSGCLSASCHTTRLSEATGTTEPRPVDAPPSFTEGQLVGVISVIMPAGQTSITLLFNRLFIIVGGLISCICAVVTFYLITQRVILEPVRSLRTAADQVAKEAELETESAGDTDEGDAEGDSWQGALEITTQIKTGDEYEQLAQAFQQMLTRLKSVQDRLRDANRTLDLRLGELESKNVALFESNKLKSEFLANVSHELRTPLNAIIGFTEILKEQAKKRNDDKSLRYATNVMTSGEGLLKIINELLDLAKIEAGKIQVRWEKCAIRDLLEALIGFTQPLIDGKNLNVNLTIDENTPIVETDPAKLHQILFNILDNAIKFTPPEGDIDIRVDSVDRAQSLQVVISDTGPGIAEEDRDKIFDKFRQLDGSVTREHTGTGLGLAIVKELGEVLGISVTVSENEPAGAIFTLSIPIQPTKSKQGQTEEIHLNNNQSE